MMGNSEQQRLFMLINQASFAMDDTRLFLDTHPGDQDAMAYFEKMKGIREEALEQYTNIYGPINSYDVNASNCWTWNEGPWPWEGGGC